MSNLEPRILVGDRDSERFERLRLILQANFRTRDVEREESFEDVERRLRGSTSWGIIFLADNLPEISDSDLVNFAGSVNRLRASFAGPIVCIVSRDEDPDPIEGVAVHIHLNSSSSTRKNEKATERVIIELRVLGKRLPEYPKSPYIRPSQDPSLREQLRGLSNERDLNEGMKTISSIAREFFDCDKVDLAMLGQGKSGSRVFLVRPQKVKKDLGEYVLKLVPDRDRWKLEREVERHNRARDHLNIGDIKAFTARLVSPQRPHDPGHSNLKYAVFYGRWYALCYQFLGGKTLGKVVDLETALLEESKKLSSLLDGTYLKVTSAATAPHNEARTRVLETQLRCLCELWYLNAKLTDRISRPLWSYQDRDPENYPELPPYKLTGRNKGSILNFLDGDSAHIGGDFLNDWDKTVNVVRAFLERDTRNSRSDKLLSRDSVVVVSPSHGDLNCNNLLLWLEQKDHPLLIDFPMYQQVGHALQDFAKIESELKFIVMDRQRGDATDRPLAFDHTFSQLPLWIEMENYLLDASWATPIGAFTQAGSHQGNVLFCLGLIQMVRSKAETVQQQPLRKPANLSFLEEYCVPLLFHTLRAIGYDSLSVFKRLLAVYSASRIIEKFS